MEERIKEILDSEGITKKDFAEKIGMTSQSFNDYATGKRLIPTKNLINIQKNFNISIDWLLTGIGEMYLNKKQKNEVRGDAKLLDLIFDSLEDMTDESKEKIYHYCKIEELSRK